MSGKYDEQIAAGMALLDEKVPGWERRVNIDRLKLSDCMNCVVGQLFRADPELLGAEAIEDNGYGDMFFGKGVYRLGIEGDHEEYGFSLRPFGEQSWAGLTRVWKRAIRARLAALGASA
jgi:hypothetical protein